MKITVTDRNDINTADDADEFVRDFIKLCREYGTRFGNTIVWDNKGFKLLNEFIISKGFSKDGGKYLGVKHIRDNENN